MDPETPAAGPVHFTTPKADGRNGSSRYKSLPRGLSYDMNHRLVSPRDVKTMDPSGTALDSRVGGIALVSEESTKPGHKASYSG